MKVPFDSRSYGGYTNGQLQFLSDHVGPPKGKTIYDPMAGQAHSFSSYAHRGANVFLSDLNPALCLMAQLRSPELIVNRIQVFDWFEDQLSKLFAQSNITKFSPTYIEEWLSDGVKEFLIDYRNKFELESSPFAANSTTWTDTLKKRFAASIPVIAARQITCFRGSDNRTWLKPGGLQRSDDVKTALSGAAKIWLRYADAVAKQESELKSGSISIKCLDASHSKFEARKKFDIVVNSPPYANRLDYFQMWAPETAVASAMWEHNTSALRARQVGSNVIRDNTPSNITEADLPQVAQQALSDIREDSESYASASYYYPYFRNYALTLVGSLKLMATQVKPSGKLIIFVRDTTRKDILFPTGLIVEQALNAMGFGITQRQRKVIKSHIGLKRKNSSGGLFGLGQQEWWLSFDRKS